MYFKDAVDGYYVTDNPKPEWIEITEQEYLSAQPAETPVQLKAEIQAQIDLIETKALMSRGTREEKLLTLPLLAYLLSTLTAQQKAALVVVEQQLYAGNPAYKAVKDADTLAAQLRAQLKAIT